MIKTELGMQYVNLDSELSLAPGFEHLVSIWPRNTNRLPDPFSTCEEYGTEGKWSQYSASLHCQIDCSLK